MLRKINKILKMLRKINKIMITVSLSITDEHDDMIF